MSTDAYGLRINMCRCQHPLECVLILSRDLCTVCHARVFLGNIKRLVVPIETSVQRSSGGCDETDHTYRSRFKSTLQNLHTTSKTMGQLAYWLAFVAQFSFQSVHRVIARQVNALMMSRRPHALLEAWLSECRFCQTSATEEGTFVTA